MDYKILNITNGDYFNEHFLSKFGGVAVPFCETMMDGNTVTDIYSDAFIDLRARELCVSKEDYRSKMQVYNALNSCSYSELHLWFGKDTFCQTNLLTLLAYLEQMLYRGKIMLNYIDDETFEVLDTNIVVNLGIYKQLYQNILIVKQPQKEIGVLSPKAIDLYFDYHSNEGMLARFIRENAEKDKRTLVCLLLEKSKDYGLSVFQAEKLIISTLSV